MTATVRIRLRGNWRMKAWLQVARFTRFLSVRPAVFLAAHAVTRLWFPLGGERVRAVDSREEAIALMREAGMVR